MLDPTSGSWLDNPAGLPVSAYLGETMISSIVDIVTASYATHVMAIRRFTEACMKENL